MYADGWQSATSNHTGGGAWESVSVTLTIPTGVSTELSAHFGIDGVSSANVSVTSGDYCEIKECQLELGDQATEFEHRSYGEELALCQRYYHKAYNSVGWLNSMGYGSLWRLSVQFPVEMRASPTISNVTYGILPSNTAVGTQFTNRQSTTFYVNDATGYAYIHFYEADAEL